MPKPSKSNASYILKHILDVYELAKDGHNNIQIARFMGVSWPTFKRWLERPEVVEVLTRARAKPKAEESFHEYIYNHLDKELKDLWEEIMECDKAKTPLGRLEAKIQGLGKRGHQNLFIHALVNSNFNLTKALNMAQLSKRKLETWIAKSPAFGKLMDEIDWHKKNFFEGALTTLVKKGHPSAVMFVNKTYNADRGYGEKRSISKDVNVTVSGGLNNQNSITVDDLQLPIEQRRAILDALREKNRSADDDV